MDNANNSSAGDKNMDSRMTITFKAARAADEAATAAEKAFGKAAKAAFAAWGTDQGKATDDAAFAARAALEKLEAKAHAKWLAHAQAQK